MITTSQIYCSIHSLRILLTKSGQVLITTVKAYFVLVLTISCYGTTTTVDMIWKQHLGSINEGLSRLWVVTDFSFKFGDMLPRADT